MKIDHSHAKRLINSARSGAVDGAILAKSAGQADKEKELNMLIASLRTKMKNNECIVITIQIK